MNITFWVIGRTKEQALLGPPFHSRDAAVAYARNVYGLTAVDHMLWRIQGVVRITSVIKVTE